MVYVLKPIYSDFLRLIKNIRCVLPREVKKIKELVMYFMKKNRFQVFSLLLVLFILYSCGYYIPGDYKDYDPVASLPGIVMYAESVEAPPDFIDGGDVYLTEILAAYIKPDGTINVMEEDFNPDCSYVFVKKIKPVDDKLKTPLGVGSPIKEAKDKAQEIHVIVNRPRDENSINYNSGDVGKVHHNGLELYYSIGDWDEEYDSLETETPLSFKTIWQKAIDAGAPSENAVAIINYWFGNGYLFRIQNTEYQYRFDRNGNLIQ